MTNLIVDWLKRVLFGAARTPAGVSPFATGTGPAKLLIMRHGEKTGEKRDPHLSEAGQQRAEKLVGYIPQQFGKPDFLAAATSSKRSSRPVETLEPLAAAFGLEIQDGYDDEDYDALVEELTGPAYTRKFGVIAWRHSDIPALVAALGAPDGTYPAAWDEAVYNVIIEIVFRDGAAPKVRQITEPF
jgi:hypothetical protein